MKTNKLNNNHFSSDFVPSRLTRGGQIYSYKIRFYYNNNILNKRVLEVLVFYTSAFSCSRRRSL